MGGVNERRRWKVNEYLNRDTKGVDPAAQEHGHATREEQYRNSCLDGKRQAAPFPYEKPIEGEAAESYRW